MSVRRHIFHLQADDIAAAEFAVDREIEHRQVTRSSRNLQFGSDRPHVLRSEWWYCTGQFALVPRFAARSLDLLTRPVERPPNEVWRPASGDARIINWQVLPCRVGRSQGNPIARQAGEAEDGGVSSGIWGVGCGGNRQG
jgi:hypothetical protein